MGLQIHMTSKRTKLLKQLNKTLKEKLNCLKINGNFINIYLIFQDVCING